MLYSLLLVLYNRFLTFNPFTHIINQTRTTLPRLICIDEVPSLFRISLYNHEQLHTERDFGCEDSKPKRNQNKTKQKLSPVLHLWRSFVLPQLTCKKFWRRDFGCFWLFPWLLILLLVWLWISVGIGKGYLRFLMNGLSYVELGFTLYYDLKPVLRTRSLGCVTTPGFSERLCLGGWGSTLDRYTNLSLTLSKEDVVSSRGRLSGAPWSMTVTITQGRKNTTLFP